jgi:rhodanese-related sulfurtransferase
MKPRPISASEAKHLLDVGTHVIFADARNPTAWGQAAAKLPGAIRIPADEASQHLRSLPSDGTVVTYCT